MGMLIIAKSLESYPDIITSNNKTISKWLGGQVSLSESHYNCSQYVLTQLLEINFESIYCFNSYLPPSHPNSSIMSTILALRQYSSQEPSFSRAICMCSFFSLIFYASIKFPPLSLILYNVVNKY